MERERLVLPACSRRERQSFSRSYSRPYFGATGLRSKKTLQFLARRNLGPQVVETSATPHGKKPVCPFYSCIREKGVLAGRSWRYPGSSGKREGLGPSYERAAYSDKHFRAWTYISHRACSFYVTSTRRSAERVEHTPKKNRRG